MWKSEGEEEGEIEGEGEEEEKENNHDVDAGGAAAVAWRKPAERAERASRNVEGGWVETGEFIMTSTIIHPDF